eukprot:2021685-Prymnesium_polylepis.1
MGDDMGRWGSGRVAPSPTVSCGPHETKLRGVNPLSVVQTRTASVALGAPRTAEVMSLFRAKGGRQTKMR